MIIKIPAICIVFDGEVLGKWILVAAIRQMGEEENWKYRNIIWGSEHRAFSESTKCAMVGSCNNDERGENVQKSSGLWGFENEKESVNKKKIME